jgi:peroxiredoxin
MPSKAPDFEAPDVEGQAVRLSDYRGKNQVVLVLLRGFS